MITQADRQKALDTICPANSHLYLATKAIINAAADVFNAEIKARRDSIEFSARKESHDAR